MKRCSKCKETQPISDFHRNSSKPDGLQGQCKSCKKQTDKKHHKENGLAQQKRNKNLRQAAHRLVASIKEASPCMDCEVSYPSYVMDFDHVRGIKFKEISQMCRAAFRIEKIPEEIEKCDLVCSNCHRVRTFACQTMPSRRRRVQCTPGYTDSVGSTTTGAT